MPTTRNTKAEVQLVNAARDGNLSEVQHLVRHHQVIVNFRSKAVGEYGNTPLHFACKYGRLDVAAYLIEQAGADVHSTNDNGWTAIHGACQNGHMHVASYLIGKAGAHVNAADVKGRTALHYACRNGHLNVARLLLQKFGANPNLPNKEGKTPLEEAKNKDDYSQFEQIFHEAAAVANAEAKNKTKQLPLPELFDVFLIHTGAQKHDLVRTMQYFFQLNGFSCFVDQDMKRSQQPNQTMEYTLENCRHAVVVISKDFLQRKSPCAELQYAFKKMLYLRWMEQWHSLWIVLYDLSMDDYKRAYEATNQKLPPIHHYIGCYWYNMGKGQYRSWIDMCQELIKDIQKTDQGESGKDQWQRFIDQGGSSGGALRKGGLFQDFPCAKRLYELERQETGCVHEGFFDGL